MTTLSTKPDRRTFLALGASAIAAPFIARPARASMGKGTPVVELFTSQGCSSCPPADLVLGELINEGVIALAHHVTYWDYLGWADPLATATGTQRQYAYAKAFGRRGVYTPQAVVNGRTHHVGSRGRELRDALGHGTPNVPVRIERVADRLSVTVGGGDAPDADVTLMRFADRVTNEIGRGENGGRTLTYHHPVHAIEPLGRWNGKATRYDANADDGGVAVLVQRPGLGPILGAAALTGEPA